MEAEIIKSDSKGITVQVKIPRKEEMLDTEEMIEQSINQAKLLALQHIKEKKSQNRKKSHECSDKTQ